MCGQTALYATKSPLSVCITLHGSPFEGMVNAAAWLSGTSAAEPRSLPEGTGPVGVVGVAVEEPPGSVVVEVEGVVDNVSSPDFPGFGALFIRLPMSAA